MYTRRIHQKAISYRIEYDDVITVLFIYKYIRGSTCAFHIIFSSRELINTLYSYASEPCLHTRATAAATAAAVYYLI